MSEKVDIRVDCYYAVSKKYEKQFPDAHFEYIMRKEMNHPLSPSWELVEKYGNGTHDWEQYKVAFIREMYSSEVARQRIIELVKIAKGKTLFLVCLEKDAKECHRSIVKWLMEYKGGEQLPPLEIALEEMQKKFKKDEGILKFLSKPKKTR